MPLFGKEQSVSKFKIADVVALDAAATGYKLVRIKQGKEGASVAAVEMVPVADLNGPCPPTEEGEKLDLPKNWMAYYVAMTVSGTNAVIRYVSLPGNVSPSPEVAGQLRDHMGLEGDYRLAYVVTEESSKKKNETRILAAAYPEDRSQALLSRVASGNPAPVSLEISCLSALNAFAAYGPLDQHPDDAVGFVEAGAKVTLLALFSRGSLVLVRKFNMGGETLIDRVQQQMGVDREVAEGIIWDGSFDISQAVESVMDPFLRQVSISKDFVERRESCRIKAVYASGGMSMSGYWLDSIQNAVGVTTTRWNPFERLTVDAGALPDALKGQESRFSAAVGAGMAVFEQGV